MKNYTRDEDAATGVIATSPTYLESGLIDYRTAVGWAIDAGFQGVICTEHYGGDGLSMSAANRDYLRTRILPRRDYVPGRESGPTAVSAHAGAGSMTRILNDPESFVEDALEGFARAHRSLVRRVDGGIVRSAADRDAARSRS